MNNSTPAQREAALMNVGVDDAPDSHTPRSLVPLFDDEVAHGELGKALEHLRVAIGEPEFPIAGRTANRVRQLAQLAMRTAQRGLGKREAARLFAHLFGALLAESGIDIISEGLANDSTQRDPKDTLGYLAHSKEPGGIGSDEPDADAPIDFDVTPAGWAEP